MRKCVLVAALLVCVAPAAAQMALPGAFEVSETGAAVYTIPIAVPPGTAGLEPKLTLQYNSRAGNGLLGVGWTLGGLPSIVRCPKTIVQDGVRGGINYDSNDRFCLEGERLVAIVGTYGSDGTEYRTEREGFSKVVSYGGAGTGPAWFKVWTKAGQVLEFGNTSDSRIEAQGKTTARLWAVNKVSDTLGNYLTVTYAEDNANGEYRPTRVDYTGNVAASVTPYASVRFVYEARPITDQTPLYEAGSLIKTTQRLTKIQSYIGQSAVRDYQLSYAQAPATQRSRLMSITLCASSSCLPATNVTWQDKSNFTYSPEGAFNITGDSLAHSNGTVGSLIGDFNGDGRTDILRWWNNPGQNAVFLSNGNGSFSQMGTNLTGQALQHSNRTYGIVLGDFNGDGRTDILRWWDNLGLNAVFLSNGDGGFSPVATNLTGHQLQHSNGTVGIFLGDFNGDGRTDILRWWDNPASNAVFLSNGDGNFSPVATNLTEHLLQHSNGTIGIFLGDFNGDGKTDIMRWADNSASHFVLLSNGDGQFTGASTNLAAYLLQHSNGTFGSFLGDFNGDGRTDILRTADNSTWNAVLLSNGDGQFTEVSTNLPGYLLRHSNGTLGSFLGDFNGDGKTDILRAWDNSAWNVMLLSSGDGQFTEASTNLPAYLFRHSNGTIGSLIGDADGDGKADILRWGDTVSGNAQISREPGLPDLFQVAANGSGSSTGVSYMTLSQAGAAYTKSTGSFACSYPCVDIQAPIPVVSRVTTSNGLSGTYGTTYSYDGAKADVTGRGFLGFRATGAVDEQTGVATTTYYQQTWPYIGLVTLRRKNLGAVELNRTENSYAADDLGSGRKFVKLTQSVESSKELSGTALPTVTTSYQYDTYGNATQVAVSMGDGHSKTTVNTYTNDLANWLLGRLTRAEVTSVTP